MIVPRRLRSLDFNRAGLQGNTSRASLLLLLSLSLLTACVANAQQEAAKTLRLGKVEVSGLERYTQEQVLTASGLQIGQAIDIPAADEAANRLMSSGLFKTLSYRFRSSGNQVTITFLVEEAKVMFPVVFDNFVWFTDQQLLDAIRREVPSFDGTAPESGQMPDSIKKALQALLNERKIPGEVDYILAASPSGQNAEHLFSVKGVKIPICSLTIPGARDVKESDLLNAAKPLFEQDYSFKDVKAFARVNLIPIYRQRGHLRAHFLDPVVKPSTDAACKNGVNLDMQVNEGYIYTWEQANWSGNNALSAQELSAALGLKQGERADGLKIDKGWMAVSEAYGKKGYIDARLRGTPEFDDANRRVSYNYTVTEGPQYRMGSLEINGVPEALAQRLKESWQLKPSDVFDASYYEKFMKKAIMEIGAAGLRFSESNVQFKPNRDNLTVSVVINIK
ncbi:MAG TPA: POTRA domain-containing protein [Pyrinomonadaceae bacterium]|jgi:outer membrane protein insertion porin family